MIGNPETVKNFSNTVATSSTDIYAGISCGDYTLDVYVEWTTSIKTLEPTIFVVDNTAKTVAYPKGVTSAQVGSWNFFYKVKLKDYPTQETINFDNNNM